MISLKTILFESKQSIVNLGFPEVIAALFYKKYGDKAYILAKWYREFAGHSNDPKWFFTKYTGFGGSLKVIDMLELYNSTFKGSDEYIKTLIKKGISHKDEYDESMLIEERDVWLDEVKEKFFDKNIFFKSYNLTKDFIDGKLKNVGPYKDLDFWVATQKYDENRIFNTITPLKTYSTGYKWINVGKRCEFVHHHMKNCGSVGVMSTDEDRTMVVLFSADNKPHVMTTYSPNEHRISGIEGAGSSIVKDEYSDYIIDLGKVLNAKIDIGRLNNNYLKIKYLLGDKLSKLKRIGEASIYSEYFQIKLVDGKTYISNGSLILSLEDTKKINVALKTKQIKKFNNDSSKGIKAIFGFYNIPIWKQIGVELKPIEDFRHTI